MDFFNPEYQIWFAIPAAVALIFGLNIFLRRRTRRLLGELHAVLAMEQRNRMIVWIGRFLLLGALFFLVMALMRPRWGSRLTVQKELGLDIVFAVDISNSMNVRDISPSRLQRVKAELTGLANLLDGNRIGIVLFAGAAFTQCPLTSDINAVQLFIDTISTGMINLQGTDISSAFQEAEKLLDNRFKRNRALVLFTDGETHEKKSISGASELYKKRQVRVFTVGVGTGSGAVIPLEESALQDTGNDPTAVKKDSSGKTVISRLDETTLRQIAKAGNGAYFSLGRKDFNIAAVAAMIKNMEKNSVGETRLDAMIDRYQIFVAAGLLLLTCYMLLPGRRFG